MKKKLLAGFLALAMSISGLAFDATPVTATSLNGSEGVSGALTLGVTQNAHFYCQNNADGSYTKVYGVTFTFTPAATGYYNFDIANPDENTNLTVYSYMDTANKQFSGSLCIDSYTDTDTPGVVHTVGSLEAGVTYYVLIDDYISGTADYAKDLQVTVSNHSHSFVESSYYQSTSTVGFSCTDTECTASEKVASYASIYPSAGKKKIKLTLKYYNETSDSADGFQIQYSVKKNFKKSSKKNIKYGKKSSTISKLKSKKTYYIRYRVYKTLSDGTKHYTVWSKSFKIKTK